MGNQDYPSGCVNKSTSISSSFRCCCKQVLSVPVHVLYRHTGKLLYLCSLYISTMIILMTNKLRRVTYQEGLSLKNSHDFLIT